MDWAHIRSFLAVAETGSLSAAARGIGQSQPTLGRHIKAAEMALGAKLFVRVPHGLQLTDAGALLLEPAREMAGAYARLSTLAAGRDTALSGTVRITASVVVSHYILPDIIARFRSQEPDIAIDLVPSDDSQNLLYREADIAIRMFRPTQLDLIARKVVDQPVALYAANKLLQRVGQPKTIDDLAHLPFVGFDRSDLIIRAMRDAGLVVDRDFFGVRCDDQAAYWRLVCAGCGVGAMQTVIGDAQPKVQKLDVQPDIPAMPVWLAAHETVYHTPRIKRVWTFLAARLTHQTPETNGRVTV